MSLSFWIRDYVFLPLAMASRSMLWRNLVLILSMVLFGLWHKASLLFILWGCYHGVLLVAHRQIQQFEKRFEFATPSAVWPIISWLMTMALVSLGWVFFRANSLAKAGAMLAAVGSLSSYSTQYVSGSLYLLVFLVGAGYAAVVAISDSLNRQLSGAEPSSLGIMGVLTQKRWYWLPALYVLVLALVLMVTLTETANTAQLMYRAF